MRVSQSAAGSPEVGKITELRLIPETEVEQDFANRIGAMALSFPASSRQVADRYAAALTRLFREGKSVEEVIKMDQNHL